MSDSQSKKNSSLLRNAPQVEKPRASTTVESQSSANNPSNGTKGKSWPIFLLLLLVLVVLAALAWVLVSQVFFSEVLPTSTSSETAQSAQLSPASEEPVSILPKQPAGVTVLEKQPEMEKSDQLATIAPVAQGADVASGFAMDLGAADSFLELSRRFAAIAALNGTENFMRLEPRAVLRDTVTGLEARLLVGPFETGEAASEACAVLILEEGITCSASPFEGELIARQ